MVLGRLKGEVDEVSLEDAELDRLAEEIIQNLEGYLKGPKGFVLKQLLKRAKNRFERDGIDQRGFDYIVSQFLQGFHVSNEVHVLIEAEKRQRENKIVEEIRKFLNDSFVKIFAGADAAERFAIKFQTNLSEAGIGEEKSAKLAGLVWRKLQKRLSI